jgi:hypothetical protein
MNADTTPSAPTAEMLAQLPPLPKPDCRFPPSRTFDPDYLLWSEQSMHAYALAALAAREPAPTADMLAQEIRDLAKRYRAAGLDVLRRQRDLDEAIDRLAALARSEPPTGEPVPLPKPDFNEYASRTIDQDRPYWGEEKLRAYGDARALAAAPSIEPKAGETWRILRAGAYACATVKIVTMTPRTVSFASGIYGVPDECLPRENFKFVEKHQEIDK